MILSDKRRVMGVKPIEAYPFEHRIDPFRKEDCKGTYCFSPGEYYSVEFDTVWYSRISSVRP